MPLVRTPAVLLHPACIFAGFAWGALSTTHRTHAVDGATQAFIVPLIPCLVGPSTRISARIGKEGFDMNAPGVRRALLLSTAVLLASLCPPPLPPATTVLLRSEAMTTPVNFAVNSARYRIDAGQSRFTVRAFAGGFLSALAHDHTISIREFEGDTDFTFGTVEPASLQMTIKAASLAVVDKISEKDRQKIGTTMRDEVLEVSKFPEITFKSNGVSAAKTGEGQYQARISGDISLHGVSRPLTIPARLEFGDKVLHAKGDFSLKQSSFGIKPVSVAGGTVKVKDEVKFAFDIVAHP